MNAKLNGITIIKQEAQNTLAKYVVKKSMLILRILENTAQGNASSLDEKARINNGNKEDRAKTI